MTENAEQVAAGWAVIFGSYHEYLVGVGRDVPLDAVWADDIYFFDSAAQAKAQAAEMTHTSAGAVWVTIYENEAGLHSLGDVIAADAALDRDGTPPAGNGAAAAAVKAVFPSVF